MMGLGGLLGDVRSGPGRFLMDALGGPFGKIAERQVMEGLMADQQGQPFNNDQFARGLLSQGVNQREAFGMLRQEDQQRHAAGQNQMQRDFNAQQAQLYRMPVGQQQQNMDRTFDIQQQREQRLGLPAPIAVPTMADYDKADKFVLQHGELSNGIGVIDRGTQLLEQYGTEAIPGLFSNNVKAAQSLKTLDNQVLAMLTRAQEAGALGDDERDYYQEVIGGDPNAWATVNGADRKMQAYKELKSLMMVKANRNYAMSTRFAGNPYYQTHMQLVQGAHNEDWLKAGIQYDPSKYAKVVRAKEQQSTQVGQGPRGNPRFAR